MFAVKEFVASTQARISLGLAMLGTLFGGLWQSDQTVLDPPKAIAVAVAVIAWFVSEIAAHQPSAHPGDLELARRLRERFPVDTQQFLREQNFGDMFPGTSTEPFLDFGREWVGAAHEFQDRAVQRAFLALRDTIATFVGSLIQYTSPSLANMRAMTVRTRQEQEGGLVGELTRAHAEQLNVQAEEVLAKLNDWERVVRRSLRI